MPNWCENTLTVQGPVTQLRAFKKKVHGRASAELQDQCLSFETTVPQPKQYDNPDGWYNWRLAHWGTKWDASDPVLEVTADSLVYKFDTAWGPPREWLEETVKKIPALTFRLFYAEGGMDFAGIVYGEDGECTTEEKAGYVEGMIEEYGSYSACCESCDGELVIENVNDQRTCEECLAHVCVHCHKRDTEHEAGKCLFDATTFKALKDADEEDTA